ncbi:polyhydroxyalkanoate synthesis repressor PhaR [Kushneria phosphatilytica]|uniref:Polyhydroxyalkanoate synthesis repressor PhaR n=1 Tax=Kushneria phosphatilytica TaxID=657387 RepID=A0A1S1NZP8_9GAMM|nr:polyhydroxyalkanoate synthesis repressor PhaR [Kushneria phosphatilytica]OHV13872.1 polyhydroxyalkanoate synthesis repressor PhaR [Kushneria phosphatilytica]QEL10425.1 polyhydroxyalkanoate synthesis repressor PhaR [Kushneria phosphatilytica]
MSVSEPCTDIRLIKKYANRRLYDTRTSSHVTLADIRRMVIEEEPFQVVDARTGEDLTRVILLQIIQEAENDGEPIFSSDMLRDLIRFYGPFQNELGRYLEQSIKTVIDIQTEAGRQSTRAWQEFMQRQTPVLQELMHQHVEHSRTLYANSRRMWDMFSGFPPQPHKKADRKEDDDEQE